ncbi:MAG TPA: M23 family metallopeptidase, partial [Pyrinomonadaceae bacterium]
MQRKCFQRKELIKTFVCLFIVLVSVAINNFQVSAQATDQPDFKLPLPPDKDWALSVETGTPSSFCGGEAGKYYGNPNTPDCYHAGNGRYSLDLLDNNRQDGDLSGRADVPILAPASGKVIKRVIDPGKRVGCACYGNYLIIDHGNGYTAIYGHLKDNSIDNIQEQQTVAAGEKIGIMGTSGDSSGIHLHFEIRYRGSGASQSAILDNLIIDGRKMIDYKVGTPTALLYYRSTNSQRYEGYLDNAKCDLIKGWAWDRTQSNIPVSVDIYDGDTKITSVVANESRPDITSYTRDNGLHGFSYPTPASLKDGKRHNIWVKISGPDHNLSFSPKTLHCGNVGNIEVASCSEVRGWAANTEQPNNIVNVSIYDGSTLITTIPANQPRPDVGAYLNDNGLHGFQYTFPSALATGAHSISVKISGANTEIDNSPKSITCGTPPPSTHYEGYLDQADCNLIKGWAVNRNSVNTPINVSI